MRIWKVKLVAILCFAVFFIACVVHPQQVNATEKVCFTLNSNKNELAKGDIVTYTVTMSNNLKGAGLDLEFIYDDSLLEVQEITKGNVFEGAAISDLNDTTSGNIRVIIVSNSVISNGSVFTVDFKVKESAEGMVNTNISKIELINENYEDIECYIENNATTVEIKADIQEQTTSKENVEDTEEQNTNKEEEKITNQEPSDMEESKTEEGQKENIEEQNPNNEKQEMGLEQKKDGDVVKNEGKGGIVFRSCFVLVLICAISFACILLRKKLK